MLIAKSIEKSKLEKILSYDPLTGILTWKDAFHKSRIGKQAGTKNNKGYICVQIDRSIYAAARLGWVLTYGDIDELLQIDHINRIRDDNRLENLRLVTTAVNNANKSTKDGHVIRHFTKRKNGSFQVQINKKYIGCVHSENEAIELVRKTMESMA